MMEHLKGVLSHINPDVHINAVLHILMLRFKINTEHVHSLMLCFHTNIVTSMFEAVFLPPYLQSEHEM